MTSVARNFIQDFTRDTAFLYSDYCMIHTTNLPHTHTSQNNEEFIILHLPNDSILDPSTSKIHIP